VLLINLDERRAGNNFHSIAYRREMNGKRDITASRELSLPWTILKWKLFHVTQLIFTLSAPRRCDRMFNALFRAFVVTIGPLTHDEWIAAGEMSRMEPRMVGEKIRTREFCMLLLAERCISIALVHVATVLLHLVCAWHSCSLNALLSCGMDGGWGVSGGRGRWPVADDDTEWANTRVRETWARRRTRARTILPNYPTVYRNRLGSSWDVRGIWIFD